MGTNRFNYVNFYNPNRRSKKGGHKTRDRIFMILGGVVVFVFTFIVYGIVGESESPGKKTVLTDNMDILAQIDLLEEQKKVKEEKLGLIKNEIFLGKNTAVDEYTESLINDLKNMAEKKEPEMQRDEESPVNIPVPVNNKDSMESILAYLQEEEEGGDTIFSPEKNSPHVIPGSEIKNSKPQKVRSLFAFSNTQRSARIYNNGVQNINHEISEESGSNDIQQSPRGDSKKMSLIFNSNPVFTIFEGEYLSASLSNRIVNDKRESPVTAVVTRDLLDDNGRFVLIPANSRVTGIARKVSGQQDTRIFIDFRRIIFPNGRSLDLKAGGKNLSGMDGSGALGIRGSKNSHFFAKFGSSILYGSLNGLSGFAQNKLEQSSGMSRFIDRASDNFNTLNDRLASDSLAIVPTITIRAGTEVRIRFASDVIISAYCRVSERTYN